MQHGWTTPAAANAALTSSLKTALTRNHHCGGGAYGATAAGAPYVTGAVAQGLQAGAGGGQATTGAGRRSQLQQQQPVLVTVSASSATRSDVLFISVSPYFEEIPSIHLRRVSTRGSIGSPQLVLAKIGHSIMPRV